MDADGTCNLDCLSSKLYTCNSHFVIIVKFHVPKTKYKECFRGLTGIVEFVNVFITGVLFVSCIFFVQVEGHYMYYH